MERVLVCDDDVVISEVVRIILFDSELAEVYTLPDCDNIIRKIETAKPSVVLMDHRLPGGGGIKATQIIKTHPVYKKIPVIYFSASDDIESHAKSAGADYMLRKPFSISQLEQVINQAVFNRNAAIPPGNSRESRISALK